ncbi:MAG: hypothetical protein GY906_27665 [bacterium]|nr:hypothetical protein [bacterium]
MTRFVLLRRDRGLKPDAQGELERLPGVKIVDQTAESVFLVEVDVETQPKLRTLLPDWIISEEVEYERPTDPLRKEKL